MCCIENMTSNSVPRRRLNMSIRSVERLHETLYSSILNSLTPERLDIILSVVMSIQ